MTPVRHVLESRNWVANDARLSDENQGLGDWGTVMKMKMKQFKPEGRGYLTATIKSCQEQLPSEGGRGKEVRLSDS